jgi:hypothetical protein
MKQKLDHVDMQLHEDMQLHVPDRSMEQSHIVNVRITYAAAANNNRECPSGITSSIETMSRLTSLQNGAS